jgi:DNA-binding FadR family transcriptional regulator
MTHKDFVKYWREKQSDKYFSKDVPKLSNRKMFTKILNMLSKTYNPTLQSPLSTFDFRKLDYEERAKIMEQIFGNNKEQYSEKVSKEIANSINVGKKHV